MKWHIKSNQIDIIHNLLTFSPLFAWNFACERNPKIFHSFRPQIFIQFKWNWEREDSKRTNEQTKEEKRINAAFFSKSRAIHCDWWNINILFKQLWNLFWSKLRLHLHFAKNLHCELWLFFFIIIHTFISSVTMCIFIENGKTLNKSET